MLTTDADDRAPIPDDARPSGEPAFTDLLMANADRLYGYCVRLTGDPHANPRVCHRIESLPGKPACGSFSACQDRVVRGGRKANEQA